MSLIFLPLVFLFSIHLLLRLFQTHFVGLFLHFFPLLLDFSDRVDFDQTSNPLCTVVAIPTPNSWISPIFHHSQYLSFLCVLHQKKTQKLNLHLCDQTSPYLVLLDLDDKLPHWTIYHHFHLHRIEIWHLLGLLFAKTFMVFFHQ